jgi:hypothetical protein
MLWTAADLRFGPYKETLATIFSHVGRAMGFDEATMRAVNAISESRFGIYEVERTGAPSECRPFVATDLATGERLTVIGANDLATRSGLWLMRFLPNLAPIPAHPQAPVSHVALASPYLLEGSKREWLAYLDRQLRPSHSSPVANDGHFDEAAVTAFFKAYDEPRRFMEYIVDGYLGQNAEGSILLTGLPDRPESLPHHPDFDPKKFEASHRGPQDTGPMTKDLAESLMPRPTPISPVANRFKTIVDSLTAELTPDLRMGLFEERFALHLEGIDVPDTVKDIIGERLRRDDLFSLWCAIDYAADEEPTIMESLVGSLLQSLTDSPVGHAKTNRGEESLRVLSAIRSGYFALWERRSNSGDVVEMLDTFRRRRATVKDANLAEQSNPGDLVIMHAAPIAEGETQLAPVTAFHVLGPRIAERVRIATVGLRRLITYGLPNASSAEKASLTLPGLLLSFHLNHGVPTAD